MKDIHGNKILEGSIINADRYYSDLGEFPTFHCVEFHEGCFGSDIYSDFEPLFKYSNIEVIGHCSEYIDIFKSGNWEGNLGAVIKK